MRTSQSPMHLGASNIDEVVDEYGRDGALDAFIASLSEDIPGGNEDAGAVLSSLEELSF